MDVKFGNFMNVPFKQSESSREGRKAVARCVGDEEDRENCGYDEMIHAHPNGRGGGSSAEQQDEV